MIHVLPPDNTVERVDKEDGHDGIACQSIGGGVVYKTLSVETAETVLRTEPQIAVRILGDAQDIGVRKSTFEGIVISGNVLTGQLTAPALEHTDEKDCQYTRRRPSSV